MLASRVGGFSQLLLSSLAPSATLTAATRVLDSAAALTSGPSCRSFAAAEPVWDPLWRQTEPLLQPTNLREVRLPCGGPGRRRRSGRRPAHTPQCGRVLARASPLLLCSSNRALRGCW